MLQILQKKFSKVISPNRHLNTQKSLSVAFLYSLSISFTPDRSQSKLAVESTDAERVVILVLVNIENNS